ncbi:PAS domain-containing protein [Methylicorpusculum sp.]|uniref:PAS domain-containing protein n=1 Tax=Methylicorpusculum sp. TaxID=2713644 RepID=UPI0027313FC8|nr:PAS domain-containing protein [Methylicorpusculum sp.]MDP2178742.1 PAS domain-containing protein [Methylicorpusculum sp.]MDP3528043.1 PAS domain-containing protein [Methylicorpusculum sp.]MDZ4150144.1 PAS domain-containing protein [Methylicorpusculum sp.]
MSSNSLTTQSPDVARRGKLLSIVIIYALFATGWILLSDQLTRLFFDDPEKIILVSLLKGWLFVIITSLMLYGLMRRWFLGPEEVAVEAKVTIRRAWLFGLLVVVIIVLTCSAMLLAMKHHKEQKLSQLQAVADLKSRQIGDWRQERQRYAEFVQTSFFHARQYRLWQESGDQQSGKELNIRLEQSVRNRMFDGGTLISPTGVRLWSSYSDSAVLSQKVLEAVHLASVDRKVREIGPYREATGTARLDFVVPLNRFSNAGAAPVVIQHFELDKWLFPTLTHSPMISASVETLLIRKEDDQVLYLNPLKDNANAEFNLRLPVATPKLLAAQLFRNEVRLGDAIEGVDYRNEPVIGVAQAVVGSDWVLICKLDMAELYAEAGADIVWIGLVGLLSLFMAGAGHYLLRQSQQLELSRVVQESQAEQLRTLNLLSAIADSSSDAIFAKDLQGRYILFNVAASSITGKPVDEVLGQDDAFLFPAAQAEMIKALGRRVQEENKTIIEEETLTTVDGVRVFSAIKGPLYDGEGHVIGLFGISRDITERKQAEERLRISEERLKLALEVTNLGLWDWDIQSDIAYLSPRYYEITGYRADEVTPDFEFYKSTIYPDDFSVVMEIIDAHLQGSIPHIDVDYRVQNPAGQITWVKERGRIVEWTNDGKPLRMIGTITDISAAKVTEHALRKQTEELAERNAEMERFNRASVGRELDMIALKQQINELSRQLSQEPPFKLSFLDESDEGGEA